MKINVFKIPKANVSALENKIAALQMKPVLDDTIDGWHGTFYLSTNNEVEDIPWVKDYETAIAALSSVKNVIHYAIHIFRKGDECFALTYGKGHFYVRKFCDPSFGLEMSKRIADENDIKQRATKRFSGKEKKGIKSFVKNTKLDYESGESIDYLSASIIATEKPLFGDKSKFGASIIISRDDLVISGIRIVLGAIVDKLKLSPRFDLPKTSEIKDVGLIAKYTKELLAQIKNDISVIETEESSYDLIGTDFVFHTDEKYTFKYGRKKSTEFANLTHQELKKFVDDMGVPLDDILNIKIEITNDFQKTYTKKLYEIIEYMVPEENIMLNQGKWERFNEEYVEQINNAVDSITIEPTEPDFVEITMNEPDFNESAEITSAGYKTADKDFGKIQIGSGYRVEAWDLQKGAGVYALKFGTAQKLVYVCSQAMATLDIIRNNANLKKLDNPPKKYCLWLGFARKTLPTTLSEIKSITLKQHIDMFARKCREIGIEPVVKISKKTGATKKGDESEEVVV